MTKSKTKKIVIVFALTLLIWVWAYQESEQSLPDTSATINISQAIDPSLLVTFDGKLLEKEFEMKVAGPAKEIDELKIALSEGREKLNFDFNAKVELMDSPGDYQLKLLKFLNGSEKITSLGLTVDSCSIKTIDVTVEKASDKGIHFCSLNFDIVAIPLLSRYLFSEKFCFCAATAASVSDFFAII